MLSRPMIGILLASAAGVFWGSMSIAAQYLMESVSFDAIDLSALRLAGAGILLLALETFVLKEDVLAPLSKQDGPTRPPFLRPRDSAHLLPFDPRRQRRHGGAHRDDRPPLRHGLDRLCQTPRHHKGGVDFDCARHGGRLASRHEGRLLDP